MEKEKEDTSEENMDIGRDTVGKPTTSENTVSSTTDSTLTVKFHFPSISSNAPKGKKEGFQSFS